MYCDHCVNSILNTKELSRWICSKAGKRSDVAHHYIYNTKHSNITILVGHLVKRVLFE